MNPSIEEKFQELLGMARDKNLEEILWEEGGQRVAFRRDMHHAPAAAVEAEPVAEQAVEEFITSPMVGTFRLSPSKDHPPLVMVGNHVKPGEHVAIVECMKIHNEVSAFCAGRITRILVEDGQPVEYGQPLFAVAIDDEGGE